MQIQSEHPVAAETIELPEEIAAVTPSQVRVYHVQCFVSKSLEHEAEFPRRVLVQQKSDYATASSNSMDRRTDFSTSE